jgi:Uma2 family endonuclease
MLQLPASQAAEKTMGLPQRKVKLTAPQYLDVERAAEHRSEFFDGEMFAMAGNSPRHSRIASNINGLLWFHLQGNSCQPYDSNLRIRVPSTGLYTYADVLVVCGPLEFGGDDRNETIVNPTLIVEVLSPTTEKYDRGKKFEQYKELVSFQEYLLVAQNEARIDRFLRGADNVWTPSTARDLSVALKCESLRIALPLADIYRGAEFDPPESIAR